MATEYIKEQSQQYQHHLQSRNKAKEILQYQHNIRTFKTIPKQFLPQKSLQLLQPTTPLLADFHKQFQDLFFDHLNAVISSNTIALELEEALLRQIVLGTEKQLATSKEDKVTIARLYQQFTTDNNIQNHDIHPSLHQRIPETLEIQTPITSLGHPNQLSPPPAPTKRAAKRKRPNLRKKQKHPKIDDTFSKQVTPAPYQTSTEQHFLDQRWDQNSLT